MLRFPLIILLVLCACTVSFGQSKKKKNKAENNQQQQSSSLSPYFPSENYEPERKSKTKKSKSKKATHNAMDEHEDRMRAVVKSHRKAEKEMDKPQYSDPSYFGHKRKPKRHAAGKLKFCKECEIRH